MNLFQRLRRVDFVELLATAEPDEDLQTERIRVMERNVGLPVKAVIIAALFYVLFFSNWFEDMSSVVGLPHEMKPARELTQRLPPAQTNSQAQSANQDRGSVQRLSLLNQANLISLPMLKVALEAVQRFFLIYVALNIAVASLLLGMRQFPLKLIQWAVLVMALLDSLLLGTLTMITGGHDSFLFWAFLGLIIRNAVSVPSPIPQIMLNLLTSLCYILAGVLYTAISNLDEKVLDPDLVSAVLQHDQPGGAESFLLRLALLLLMTACCYGVQVLFEKQRRAEEEAREFALRQEQLHSAGRLAAEIAHQIKNPLGIINNAAFTLQRNVKEGKGTITQQIQIIREEVERSDRILTELMGYAQLAEGKVERVSVLEELDRAIDQVFPPAIKSDIAVHRHYAPALPQLLLQRAHLAEIFTNLLQNAREALPGRGQVHVQAVYADHYAVQVAIRDDGPGIPAELREKVFEAYFTTKEKGTGLGLAIVKHNVEMYSGSVKVESELGKGTTFTLMFPARSLMKLRP